MLTASEFLSRWRKILRDTPRSDKARAEMALEELLADVLETVQIQGMLLLLGEMRQEDTSRIEALEELWNLLDDDYLAMPLVDEVYRHRSDLQPDLAEMRRALRAVARSCRSLTRTLRKRPRAQGLRFWIRPLLAFHSLDAEEKSRADALVMLAVGDAAQRKQAQELGQSLLEADPEEAPDWPALGSGGVASYLWYYTRRYKITCSAVEESGG